MADIRINALATTAASTASDDFVAVDGSANGTRKLNAYSPTFGGNVAAIGNLTVSGTINVGGGVLGTSTGNDEWKIVRGATTNYATFTFRDSGSSTEWAIGRRIDSVAGAGNFSFYSSQLGSNALTLFSLTGNATLAGNLTVSGTAGSWASGVSAIDLSTSATLYGTAADVGLVSNAYYDGAWKRKTANATGRYQFQLGGGDHIWYSAGSGSANSSITFTQAMTLTNSGNLLIGTTTDGGQKLQVSGTGYFSAGITIGGTSDVGTGGVLWQDAGSPYSTHLSGANLKFETGSNFARTTALTLDSSQNATFAGWASIRGTGSGSAQWIGDDGADGWFLNVPTSNLITLGINNTARVVIKANTVQIVNLPTSSSGLNPGDLWNDSGTVKIA